MTEEYDALMFYRTTYGDLSPHATYYALKHKEKQKKKTLAKKPNSQLREQRQENKYRYSLSRYKYSSCERKVFYATETLALKAIKEQSNKLLTYYGCDFCGGFHLTTIRNEKIL